MMANSDPEARHRIDGLLWEADQVRSVAQRHLRAYAAAVAVGDLVLTARLPGHRPGAIPLSRIWRVLCRVAPEYAEWGLFFDSLTGRHREVLDGAQPSSREADDLLRDATSFRDRVVARLHHPAYRGRQLSEQRRRLASLGW
ncbi:hypothetical protein CGZ91_09930 [Parenemella sanctibonifatiensis]|uniref:SAV-6107-like HEPN domain-containing protein n=2 Tax=Parenemella sanctibonifatiensis TaxID=2016505 RepID=A0A255EF09_9ACTN|nr:hypothetical protein CGZ91_09930 [Parenemella sanctibonifatiensis]